MSTARCSGEQSLSLMMTWRSGIGGARRYDGLHDRFDQSPLSAGRQAPLAFQGTGERALTYPGGTG
jgi:hypothetical protein